MSTRSCIARKTDIGFKGVYHHWDGLPRSLGATLFELFNGHFNKDLDAMLKYLIDEHPAGWSTINDKDFNSPPGFIENGFQSKGPECYCHGGRKEKAWEVNEINASRSGCEYAYVFYTKNEKSIMEIMSSYRGNGNKMIGAFGMGDEAASWKLIKKVNLNGGKPNWSKIEDEIYED